MKIHGLNKTTLLDYPEHLACTVFTGHCNFRCPFCHNGELVLCPDSQGTISEDEFFTFLDSRLKRLDGVAITGGEPTVNADLKDFIKKIKERGLLVKLDTNGSAPNVVKDLIDNSLIDYVAMDIKTSLSDYAKVCGLKSMDVDAISESIKLIMNSGIDYEFRTTVCKELHNKDTFRDIANMIKGCSKYYLQSYRSSDALLVHMMDDEFKSLYPSTFSAYKNEEMKEFKDYLCSLGVNTHVRGIEE